MTSTFSITGIFCLLALSGSLVQAGAPAPGMAADSAAPAPTATASQGVFSAAVDPSSLEGYRGGNVHVRNDMTLAGTTADNTAQHVNTGSNAISSGAFANMSGMPVVIQNSGANVLIQNAVILNVQMN